MMSISEYFTGKNVFITGGSGFIGKALIEMLLRCCPGIGKIYILMREKKGKSIEERIREITNNPLFDTLKEQQPTAIDKITPIFGDILKLRLGISLEDEKLLISTVNIIYHAAASVRFDDPLRLAIITNLRSTVELASLALKCKKLEVFCHMSTAYSNTHMSVIDEKCYPSLVPWQDALALAEQDHPHLEALTLKYIAPMPNTYTFTKSLAENAALDMCKGKIPLIIIRPSIVINAITTPIPGWGDNLNGPFGLIVAGMKGIVNLFNGGKESFLDIVCVDNLVKSCIMAVWKESAKTKSAQISEISVYNITTDLRWFMRNCNDMSQKLCQKVPLTGRLWYSKGIIITTNLYYCRFFVTHVIPALLIDAALKLTGREAKLMKVTRRIYLGNDVLQYFMKKSFTFKNKNYLNLDNDLLESDMENFKICRKLENVTYSEIEDFVFDAIIGIKKYVLHEPVPVHDETFRNTRKLQYLDRFVKLVFTGFLLYLLLWKLDMLTLVGRRVHEYIENL